MQMPDYSQTTAAILEKAKKEEALPLKNEACRSKFFFHPHPTPKVCLFFHGFTAGPYQFEPIGKAFFDAGYNVLVPLQPGHGKAGDWDGDNPPPLPTDVQVYQRFVREWLDIAQTLGEKVIVGGLSTGGNLAAWLALEYPQQIDRALVFAPYLSSSNKLVDWLVDILPFYFEWFNKDAPGNFGYDGFPIPGLELFLDLGKEILERSPNAPTAPMFVLSSDGDRVTSQDDQRALFQAALQHQPKAWYYCFDENLKIAHRMMTKMEGNDYQDLVIALAKAYVESDLSWAEVKKIAQQMRQGKSFKTVVEALNLQRVSPELSIMLTLLVNHSSRLVADVAEDTGSCS
jgi:pimeloyl-ACP methyl ester carboxylesterase